MYEKETSRKCPACRTMALCSTRCDEEVDYPYHSFRCSYRLVEFADHLALASLEDKLPEDLDTLENFGFTAFSSFEGISHLLGLYHALLNQNIVEYPEQNTA